MALSQKEASRRRDCAPRRGGYQRGGMAVRIRLCLVVVYVVVLLEVGMVLGEQ